MPITGFHSEWVTIKDHRILIECRGSFPTDTMRFIASVAVETCDNNSESARVVHIYYDDPHSIYSVKIASDRTEDQRLGDGLTDILQGIFGNGNYTADVTIVKEGRKDSDHYCHAEHLSISSDVAVSRWASADDKEYQNEVEPPR